MQAEKNKRTKTLQFQITAVVGIVLALACAVLTLNSIYSSNKYYLPDMAYPSGPDRYTEKEGISAAPDETMVEQDQVTFADQWKAFSVQGLFVMAVTIGVSLLFTYWLTGRMLKPLITLTHSIRRVDDGNLKERIEIQKSTEEVRRLTVSYNKMMDRLEEAFLSQKRFAANAAHELKTPLAVMKTSLQVLLMDEEPSGEDYAEFAEDVGLSVERLISTVDGLLLLASDVTPAEKETVDMRELLTEIREHLSPQARERKVEILVQGESVCLNGNRILLYRVFYNVIENAVKYNREGGTVRAEALKTRHGVCVSVKDTGRGMSVETLKNMYEPFYRADQSRSQKIQGSGLGMAVVRMIVDRFHGTIQAESEPGRGTEIKITFPDAEMKSRTGDRK